MSLGRRKNTESPIDRISITRFCIADMMTTIFPGWPTDGLEKIISEETGPTQAGELISQFFDEHFFDDVPPDTREAYREYVISVIRDASNYLPHISTEMTFINDTGGSVRLYWINFEGERHARCILRVMEMSRLHRPHRHLVSARMYQSIEWSGWRPMIR
jgi:hypothetical protein